MDVATAGHGRAAASCARVTAVESEAGTFRAAAARNARTESRTAFSYIPAWPVRESCVCRHSIKDETHRHRRYPLCLSPLPPPCSSSTTSRPYTTPPIRVRCLARLRRPTHTRRHPPAYDVSCPGATLVSTVQVWPTTPKCTVGVALVCYETGADNCQARESPLHVVADVGNSPMRVAVRVPGSLTSDERGEHIGVDCVTAHILT